jgi:hypothetical protein
MRGLLPTASLIDEATALVHLYHACRCSASVLFESRNKYSSLSIRLCLAGRQSTYQLSRAVHLWRKYDAET